MRESYLPQSASTSAKKLRPDRSAATIYGSKKTDEAGQKPTKERIQPFEAIGYQISTDESWSTFKSRSFVSCFRGAVGKSDYPSGWRHEVQLWDAVVSIQDDIGVIVSGEPAETAWVRQLNTPGEHALSSLDSLKEPAEISKVISTLEEAARSDNYFRGRLSRQALNLVQGKKIGSAAALEVCARLVLSEALPAFELALRDSPMPQLVREIAAQRIRAFPIEDNERRSALGATLEAQIENWLADGTEEAARDAFLSVAFLLGVKALPWLTEIIQRHASAEVVEASVHAACSLLSHQDIHRSDFELNAVKGFLGAVSLRLRQGSLSAEPAQMISIVRARLIEAVGAFSGWAPHDEVAKTIADSFASPDAIERAAAVRASGHFARAVGETAGTLLLKYLSGRHPDLAGRFLTLALMGRR